MEWQKDAKNQYATFEYDALGRPTSKKLRPTGGVSGPVTENTETIYGTNAAQFEKGRVTQVVTKNGAGVELSGKTTFGYDELGRAKTQTKYIDGTAYTVNRNFDSAGYLRGIQYPDGDVIGQYNGSGTALGYDQAGRLTSIPGILNSVTYNALGSPLVQTNANGTTTTKTYDSNRFWLTAISTTTPSVAVQNLSYTLNEVGMALQVGSPIANEQRTYTYDNLGRLTSSVNGVAANNQTWTYNNLGNILTNSVAGNYTYAGPRPHAVTSVTGGPMGSLSFTYDANGNMETGNGRSIAWRPDNLPSSVTMTATSTTTSFTYDPFGERVKKTTGATSTVYPFGDDYEINGGVVTKYVNAGFGVIAKRVGSTNYWLHTDRLGSINATTDNTGAEVLRRTYRAYGDLLGQTGTNTESRGYIGQRQDPETGMTYLHARLYDSKLGVFVSPDPSLQGHVWC